MSRGGTLGVPSMPNEDLVAAEERIQRELAESIDGALGVSGVEVGDDDGQGAGGAGIGQVVPLGGSIRTGRSGALLPRGGASDVFSPQHTGLVLEGGLGSPNRTRNLVPLLPAGSYMGIVQGGTGAEKGSRAGQDAERRRVVTVFSVPRSQTTRSLRRGKAKEGKAHAHGAGMGIVPAPAVVRNRAMLEAALRQTGRS